MSNSGAIGINNNGVIVGASWLGNEMRGFVYVGGQMRDLNQLLDLSGEGWIIESANAINDDGWIVGTGFYNGGKERAFLLIPVPEPSSFLLGVLGVFCALGGAKNTTECSDTEKLPNSRSFCIRCSNDCGCA